MKDWSVMCQSIGDVTVPWYYAKLFVFNFV